MVAQVNDQRSAAASSDAGTNSNNNNILPYFHEMVANPDEVDADGNLIVNSDGMCMFLLLMCCFIRSFGAGMKKCTPT